MIFNRRYLFEMRSCVGKRRGVDEHIDVVRSFLGLPIYALNDDLLRALISEQKPFMQFPSNVIYAFVVPEDPLGDGLSDLPDQTFHIKIFQHTTHYCMCKEICGSQGKHETRGDGSDCLEEVGGKLEGVNTGSRPRNADSLTEYPLNAGSQATKNCDTEISGGPFEGATVNSQGLYPYWPYVWQLPVDRGHQEIPPQSLRQG